MRLSLILLFGACATGGRPDAIPDSGSNPTPTPDGMVAPPGTPDSSQPADASQPQPSEASLMITEVALAPAGGELVEIANPTSQTIDLASYYLSDSGNYFRLPAGATVDSSDFIVKFPAGATLAPGAVISVAFDTAANFQTTYGSAPTFSIASGTMTAVAASGTPTLTNAGELVVLFQWDGQADLVGDVDLLLVGVPSAANGLVDKSAVAIDGPDADTTASVYGADARTIAPQAAAPGAGVSTKRVARESAFQSNGGNGLAGEDETSENTSMTFDSAFTAPTPGGVPSGLLP
ncbi:MAG: lamin tail domain-containing protein [Deltaproteobacteria bacterium]|nr:lamin tail domain-containing protein [Deltaproteobacteria bacterium]